MDSSSHLSFFSSTSHSSESSERSTASSSSNMSKSSHNSSPMKVGLNMRSQSHLPVKDTLDLLRTEVGKCKHLNINLLDFVIEVWGVDAPKAKKILDMKMSLPQADVDAYKAKRSENELHEPFIAFCDTLLKAAQKEVGESDSGIDGGLWDGEGEVVLVNAGRERKPDLLYMWVPLPDEGVVPKWNEVNAIVEMKHQDYKLKKKTKSTSLAASVLASSISSSHVSSSHASTSVAESSGGTTTALGKRSISAVTDSSAADDRDTKKSRSTFGTKKLQLGNYALETLATTSRYYATGLLVDTCKVTACYFDRNLVLCAQSFFFDAEPQNLALILYALNQCDIHKAGFDPHLRPWSSSTLPQDVTEAMKDQVLRPVKDLVGSYFEFPTNKKTTQDKTTNKAGEKVEAVTLDDAAHLGEAHNTMQGDLKTETSEKMVSAAVTESGQGPDATLEPPTEAGPVVAGTEDTSVRLSITGIIRQPDDLISRGTTVYKVKYQYEDGTLSKEDYALKLSWPLKSRVSEIEVVEHLRKMLPDDVKAHLPNISFSTTYTCQQLGLPWTRLQLPLDDSNHQERVLRGMVADHYSKLWEANSVDEFLQVWLDCVECHREAYRVGKVLHRDLSENNLMIFRLDNETAKGLLNDWDMSTIWRDGLPDTLTAAHHRTGTPPFMAIDLLCGRPWQHLYRYDLESFVYILVWAAIQYNLREKKRAEKVHAALRGWVTGTMVERGNVKDHYVNSPGGLIREGIEDAIQEDFKPVLDNYITPLLDLLKDAYTAKIKPQRAKRPPTEYDYDTCGGTITFHKFMKKIGKAPRWDKVDPEASDA